MVNTILILMTLVIVRGEIVLPTDRNWFRSMVGVGVGVMIFDVFGGSLSEHNFVCGGFCKFERLNTVQNKFR
jgi:hypothetical protein